MTEKKGGSGPRLDVVISAGKEEEEEEEEVVAWSPSCLPLPASSYPACKVLLLNQILKERASFQFPANPSKLQIYAKRAKHLETRQHWKAQVLSK